MAGLDFLGSVGDFLTDAASDINDWFSGVGINFDVMQVGQDALLNGAIAGFTGQDVFESALYGGFGSIVGDSKLFGDYSNEVEGAIKGYGATGELYGAAGGALLENLSQDDGGLLGKSFVEKQSSGLDPSAASELELEMQKIDKALGGSAPTTESGILSKANSWMAENGLVDEDGNPTLLAKMGMGAVSAYDQRELLKDQAERYKEQSQFNSDLRREEYDHTADKNFSDQQRNIGLMGRV